MKYDNMSDKILLIKRVDFSKRFSALLSHKCTCFFYLFDLNSLAGNFQILIESIIFLANIGRARQKTKTKLDEPLIFLARPYMRPHLML